VEQETAMKIAEWGLWLVLAALIPAAAWNAHQQTRTASEAAWTEPRCSELARLEGELIAARERYTDEHPRIKLLKSRILDLFNALTSEVNGKFVFQCPTIAPVEPPTPVPSIQLLSG
jgi:hypothetical protein